MSSHEPERLHPVLRELDGAGDVGSIECGHRGASRPRELGACPSCGVEEVARVVLAASEVRVFVEKPCARALGALDRGLPPLPRDHFCAAREDGLPERDYLAGGLASGETEVSVIAD